MYLTLVLTDFLLAESLPHYNIFRYSFQLSSKFTLILPIFYASCHLGYYISCCTEGIPYLSVFGVYVFGVK